MDPTEKVAIDTKNERVHLTIFNPLKPFQDLDGAENQALLTLDTKRFDISPHPIHFWDPPPIRLDYFQI